MKGEVCCGGATHTQLLIPPFRPLVTFLGFGHPLLTIQTSVRSMNGIKGRILMKTVIFSRILIPSKLL